MTTTARLITPQRSIHELVGEHARELSAKLQAHRLHLFPPAAQKTLRQFSSTEAAKLVGVNDGYLRRLSIEGKGPTVEVGPEGRRSYTIEDLQSCAAISTRSARATAITCLHRTGNEHLQVITVVNFKGGSGKTTTAAHLAPIPRFARLPRARASISTPRQACPPSTACSRNSTSARMKRSTARFATTIAAANSARSSGRPISRNLDLVPGNLELMEFEHETPRASRRR